MIIIIEERWPWVHGKGQTGTASSTQPTGILPEQQTQSPGTRMRWIAVTLHLECDSYSLERGSARDSDSLFLFSFHFQGGLLNSLFTHLTLAYSNNNPWTWIILRHCVSHRVLSCFHDLGGWLSALSEKPLRMCKVISGFNFNQAWCHESSIYC